MFKENMKSKFDMHDCIYMQAQLIMKSMAVPHKKVYVHYHHKAFSILNVLLLCAWPIVM